MNYKHFEYFLSFRHVGGSGNLKLKYHKKINSVTDLKRITKKIEKEGQVIGVTIISYTLLRKTRH